VLVGKREINGKKKRIYTDSFDVIECPQFELLEMLR
jgi:hypothetical protein